MDEVIVDINAIRGLVLRQRQGLIAASKHYELIVAKVSFFYLIVASLSILLTRFWECWPLPTLRMLGPAKETRSPNDLCPSSWRYLFEIITSCVSSNDRMRT